MATAEGVVRGHVYGSNGWMDCTRPCMWLDGGFCRLKRTDHPPCVPSAKVVESEGGGLFELKEGVPAPPRDDTVYRIYRGDEFVDVGTSSELCERHGWKRATLRYLASPVYRRRAEGKRWLMAEKVG